MTGWMVAAGIVSGLAAVFAGSPTAPCAPSVCPPGRTSYDTDLYLPARRDPQRRPRADKPLVPGPWD